MKLSATYVVDMSIRALMFTIPTTFVAAWCDVSPTWKSSLFMAFCIVWYEIVRAPEDNSAGQDELAARKKPKAVDVLTPSQVAAEARKLMRGSKPRLDR